MGARTDAISRAYKAFAVPAPDSLGVCTACCMDPAMERAMLRKQPCDLTLTEVREWLSAAFSNDTDGRHIAWIMPRILELLTEGNTVAVGGNEVALARLRQAGFPDGWSPQQSAAVGSVCMIVLDQHIEARKPYLDELLCMIANSGLDIAPYLARLDVQPDDVLADLLYRDWTTLNGLSIWRTSFWEDVPHRQTVWNWFTSIDLETRMWRAASEGDMRALEVAEAIARSPAVEPDP